MFKVNVAAVAEMTKMERVSVEEMCLNLTFLKENEVRLSGSRAMRRSPEQIVMERSKSSFADLQAKKSFNELFSIADEVQKRTGLWLISFKKEDMTPANARRVWRELYQTVNATKLNKAVL